MISLILWWKRPAWVPFPITLALIIILVAGNEWVSNGLIQSLEWQNIPQNIPNAEAIIVLGGATKSASFPRPMVDLNEQGDRVVYAAKLYQDHKAPLIIASGGRIKWGGQQVTDKLSGVGNSFRTQQQPESADIATLLTLMGVPPSAILQDSTSLNTYENVVNVKKILNEKGIKRVLLVTSALHMPRSLLIFKKQGIDVIPAPTDFLVSQPELEQSDLSVETIMLNLIPDAGRLEGTTKALKEYIGMVIYRLKGWL